MVFRAKDDKSNYLRLAGYAPDNWFILARHLQTLADVGEAQFDGEDGYGPTYTVVGELTGPNGRTLQVKTVWKRDVDEGITKFITLYPAK